MSVILKMSRKFARESAFRLLYGFCMTGTVDPSFTEAFRSAPEMDADDAAYFDRVLCGAAAESESLFSAIASATEGFSLERIYKVDLAALLLAAYELKNCPEVNVPVIVDEAVTLADKYSADKSGSFVNGILAKLVGKLRVES